MKKDSGGCIGFLYDVVLANKSPIKVKEKRLLALIFYLVITVIGQILFHHLNQLEYYKDTLHAPLWFYQIVLVSIGVFAFFSLRKFDSFEKTILINARFVLKKSDYDKITHFIFRKKYSLLLAVVFSLFVSLLFVSYTNLSLSKYHYLSLYAYVLVFSVAMSVSMAYIILVISVLSMRKVYLHNFRKYDLFCPISTNIFKSYNRLIASGLTRFWMVSIPVLCLTLFVTQRNSLIVSIAILIVLGFVIFTIYPFYFTGAKVNELKMSSMRRLLKSRAAWSDKAQIAKVLQDSPNQTTGNIQSLFWSTALAGCTFAIQQLISGFHFP